MHKKIIFLGNCPLSLINFKLPLMKEFLHRNYSVIAFAPANKEVEQHLAKLGIQFVATPLARTGLNPIKDLMYIFKLIRLFRNYKPDILFSYTIKPVIYGSFAAKFAKIPSFYSMISGTGYAFTEASLLSKMVGIIVKKMLRVTLLHNDRVFFLNPDNAQLFLQNRLIHHYDQLKIVNGEGVDLQFYKKCDLPEKVSFLMIARLLKDKGLREYAAAAASLKKQYPSISFKLVGWIDSNPEAISEKELNEWVQSGVITFLGRLDDVREVIKRSAVFVLPSYAEGIPRTVLEAMAMGRPIITTNAPGCKETVIDGVNGFIIPTRDSHALAQAMKYFIEFPENIKTMGEQSYEMAKEKYDVHRVNHSILQAMQLA